MVVAAFNQEKALVVITNLRMELFEALLGEACGKTELLISARTPLWMQLIEQFLQEMVRPRDPLLGMGYVKIPSL